MLRSVFSPSLSLIASSNFRSTSVCSSRCSQRSVNAPLCNPYVILVLHFYDYYDRTTVWHGALWGTLGYSGASVPAHLRKQCISDKPAPRRLLVRHVLQVIEALAELRIRETGNACECVCDVCTVLYSVAERKLQRRQQEQRQPFRTLQLSGA